jgi:hypothetical protein
VKYAPDLIFTSRLRRVLLAIAPLALAACGNHVIVDARTNSGSASPSGHTASAGPTGSTATASAGVGGAGGGSGVDGQGGGGGDVVEVDGGPGVALGPGFHLIGAYGDSSSSTTFVDLIDPTTGKGALVGQLGQGGLNGIVLSPDGMRVYTVGNLNCDPLRSYLLTLDVQTGITTQAPKEVDSQCSLVGVTDKLQAVALCDPCDYCATVELIDPVSGSSTTVGKVGVSDRVKARKNGEDLR